jgi:hypothetical protein
MQLKYLIVETKDGIPVPILFSELLQHNAVCVLSATPVSGGYVRLLARDDGGVFAACHGESISLGLRPAKGDSQLIESYLNKLPGATEIRDGNW